MSADGTAPSESGLEAGGHVKGLATAIVKQNKDDSGEVNVRVSYPWHSQPRESYPARIATPMAGKDRGMYFVPEVNDEVLVGFEKGDLGHPYIIGCLWSGKDPAPEKNSDGKNDRRLIRTRKGHKLLFDDGQKGLVQLELNDGKKLSIDDDKITLDAGNNTRLTINKSGAVSLEAQGKLTLKGASVSIQATGTVDIQAGAILSISGTPVKIN